MKTFKRGEISSAQIVITVIAVLGIAIALIFLGILKGGDYSEDDICKLSVLTAATSPSALQSYIPLKCTTKKICLTKENGKCASSFAGEEITQIKLPSDNTSAARKIEEVSANAMYNCWNLMGQGKLNVFGSYKETRGLIATDSSCVICSRVALDNDVGIDIINKIDVNKYLKENQITGGSLTYLQAFTDKGVSSYANVDDNAFKAGLEKKDRNEIEKNGKTISELSSGNSRQIAFVFMQIKITSAGDAINNLLSDVITGGVGGFLVAPKTTLKVARVLAFTKAGAIGTVAVAAGTVAYAYYNAFVGQTLAAGYCGVFASSQGDAEKGCSIVQAVPYTVQNINSICHAVEGNP